MEYRVEILDASGLCVAAFDDVPLFEARRGQPDVGDVAQGMLPWPKGALAPGYVLRVSVGGRLFLEAPVERVTGLWGDNRKLILDRYVNFHEVLEVQAVRPAFHGNGALSKIYTGRGIQGIVKHAIMSARGAIHYTIDHDAYPDGAVREYQKFLSRKTAANELQHGGIASGQWVGASRINVDNAVARDGDTISGLVVDGVAWPDVRLLMIDAEECSRNSHAISRHPEVAAWTDEVYARSGYKQKADLARDALQSMINEDGISYIELNPHRNAAGAFDDRVDAYGRYLGLVYGGGKCFNAGLVEKGLADVYQWEEGRYHVPEMELKDFFSYGGPSQSSVAACGTTLSELDLDGGVMEALTALSYAAGGYVWSIDPNLRVQFRTAARPDWVFDFDPMTMAVAMGADSATMCNTLYLAGNPAEGALEKTYRRYASQDAYGVRIGRANYFSLHTEPDADKLAAGLLDDLAYPATCGYVQFYRGMTGMEVGDLLELRGSPLGRLDPAVAGEWGGRFETRLLGRIAGVTHRLIGREVITTAFLTSPLRSVANPLSVMVRGQDSLTRLYQFRLDEEAIGLDMGYHLD